MNYGNPPPYSDPGPTAPYPPYVQQPGGPQPYPPAGPYPAGPQGPYPPPNGGYPYQGYPQYGWQGGPPPEAPKPQCMWWKTKDGMTQAKLPASQLAGLLSVAVAFGTC